MKRGTFFDVDSLRSKKPVVTDQTLQSGKRPELFQSLMVDPPWPYDQGAQSDERGNLKADKNWTGRVSSVHRYGSMSIEELCDMGKSLPIAENAHLYLWFTNAFVREATRIARAWDFKQKTIITWVKTNAGTMKPRGGGAGYYFRNNTEHMLFCVRGSLKTKMVHPPHTTTIHAPAAGHSQKPAKSYRLVEDSSPGPWLEVFSRTQRPGWFLFGDQIKDTK